MIRLEDVVIEAPQPTRPRLLDGVTLEIRSDEYIVLCGPNGSGKSLLLKVLAGLLRPRSGVRIGPPAVGFLFQNPDDQIVGSTVARDVAFGLENEGVALPEMRVRVDGALADFALNGLATRAPHLLSDGEKQRLALASSHVLAPPLLLLDEPSARLDPLARTESQLRILEARRRGTTVVVATHRSEEIVIADRVIGLRDGRLVFDGTPDALVDSPEADALGILWTDLHRLWRELRRLGRGDPAGLAWNDTRPLLAGLAAS